MNLLGWGVTGLVLFIILSKRAPAPNGEVRFAIWVYLINFALPLGFRVLNRYWLAVLAGSGSVAIALLLFGYKQKRFVRPEDRKVSRVPQGGRVILGTGLTANYRFEEQAGSG
jgi:hypothetical protein